MWNYGSTTHSRPAEGEIYLTDIGCLCNEMKRVCKVDYFSGIIDFAPRVFV